jgi:hypothetical protein
MSNNPSSGRKVTPCYSTRPATNQNAGYGFRFVRRGGRLIKIADPEERAVMARIVLRQRAILVESLNPPGFNA